MAETMQTDASRQREIRRSIGDEIFDEGRVEGRVEALRGSILRQGKKRFGAAPTETVDALNTINDVESLEQLSDRLLDVNSWVELMES